MSSQMQRSEQQRPTWGHWLLALGLALVGTIIGAWANSSQDSLLPVLLFVLIVGVATLLGGALLNSWWAAAALPVAVLAGMALVFVNVSAEAYLPTVLGSWLVVGLPVAVACAMIGVALRRFIDDRVQQSRPGADAAE